MVLEGWEPKDQPCPVLAPAHVDGVDHRHDELDVIAYQFDVELFATTAKG